MIDTLHTVPAAAAARRPTVRGWIVPAVASAALGGCVSGIGDHTATDAALRTEAADPLSGEYAGIWTPIGRSVEGRVIEALTLGAGPRRVLIIGGIHGDETEGTRHVGALVEHLRRDEGTLSTFTIMLIRDGNPDGAARRTRSNARGVDLNRNWPASNFEGSLGNGPSPLSEPEARAMHSAMLACDPEAVLVLHSSRNGPFVNFDGDGAALAGAFTKAAGEHDPRWKVVPSMGYPTPGSLGTWFGVDGRGPILTIEFRRGERGGTAREALIAGTNAALRALDN